MVDVDVENVNDVIENVNDIPDVNDEKTTFLHIHSDIGTNATLNFFTKPSYLTKLKKLYSNEKDGSSILNHDKSIKFYINKFHFGATYYIFVR